MKNRRIRTKAIVINQPEGIGILQLESEIKMPNELSGASISMCKVCFK